MCPIGSINSIIICKYWSQLQREYLSVHVYNIYTYDICRHKRVKPKVLFLKIDELKKKLGARAKAQAISYTGAVLYSPWKYNETFSHRPRKL